MSACKWQWISCQYVKLIQFQNIYTAYDICSLNGNSSFDFQCAVIVNRFFLTNSKNKKKHFGNGFRSIGSKKKKIHKISLKMIQRYGERKKRGVTIIASMHLRKYLFILRNFIFPSIIVFFFESLDFI